MCKESFVIQAKEFEINYQKVILVKKFQTSIKIFALFLISLHIKFFILLSPMTYYDLIIGHMHKKSMCSPSDNIYGKCQRNISINGLKNKK